jgi:hypothetical protein
LLPSRARFRFTGHRQSSHHSRSSETINALRNLNAKDAAGVSVTHTRQFQLSFVTPSFGRDARSRWSLLPADVPSVLCTPGHISILRRQSDQARAVGGHGSGRTAADLSPAAAAAPRVAIREPTAANAENRLQSPAEGPDIAPGNGAPAAFAEGQDAIALDALIEAHQATHGDFADTAAIAQALKSVLDVAAARLGAVQREALDQIATKLARICAGDPTCADHWRDLASYAWLAGRELVGGTIPATVLDQGRGC